MWKKLSEECSKSFNEFRDSVVVEEGYDPEKCSVVIVIEGTDIEFLIDAGEDTSSEVEIGTDRLNRYFDKVAKTPITTPAEFSLDRSSFTFKVRVGIEWKRGDYIDRKDAFYAGVKDAFVMRNTKLEEQVNGKEKYS